MAVQDAIQEVVFDGTLRDRLTYQIRINRALLLGMNATRSAGKGGVLSESEMAEMEQAYSREEQPEAFALVLSGRDTAAFLDSIEPGEHPHDEARDARYAEMGVEI